MKAGTIVKVKNIPDTLQTTWVAMFSGEIGVIEARCQLYKNSWYVRFGKGNDSALASLKTEWLEKLYF